MKKLRGTYDEFDDINGGKIGTKSRDAKIETASEELLGLLLTVGWEIRVDTSATVHRYSPASHLSLWLSCLSPSSRVCCACVRHCNNRQCSQEDFIDGFGLEMRIVVDLILNALPPPPRGDWVVSSLAIQSRVGRVSHLRSV